MAAINNKGSRQYNLIKYRVVISKSLCNSGMMDCYLTLNEQYISYIYDKSKFTRHKSYRYKKVALVWGYGRKSRFSHGGKRYNGNGQKSLPCNRLPTATNNKLLHIMSYCTLSFNRNGIEFSFMSCPIPNGNKCI